MIPDDLSRLIQKYHQRGLLIDANLLLLFFTGITSLELIGSFKRTRTSGFTITDYQILTGLITKFRKIVTTPNILTEVSNLSKFSGKTKEDYFVRFGIGIMEFEEQFVPSRDFCRESYFGKFGLTDAAIIHASRDRFLVLTSEFPLANYLQQNDVDVINFNHLRQVNWS